jgi:hypothetical protein
VWLWPWSLDDLHHQVTSATRGRAVTSTSPASRLRSGKGGGSRALHLRCTAAVLTFCLNPPFTFVDGIE